MATRRVKKVVGLDWQNNNFARASHFLYISLASLHAYNGKLPIFADCGGCERDKNFFLNFDTVLYDSTPEKLAIIYRIARDRINAVKFEASRILFLSDVFVARRRSCCLKAPYFRSRMTTAIAFSRQMTLVHARTLLSIEGISFSKSSSSQLESQGI